jgi:hypothetical protein
MSLMVLVWAMLVAPHSVMKKNISVFNTRTLKVINIAISAFSVTHAKLEFYA